MPAPLHLLDAGSPPPGAASAAADLDSLLRVVLYFDVFRHPLRPSEAAWMAGLAEPGPAIAAAVARGYVEPHGGYLPRAGKAADVARRRERAAHAERIWPAAMTAARVLAALPFVRGVMLTGGLSKLSSEPGGDADFLLLVEPGCVWTTKSALQVARRAMPEAVRRLFCTNYLLATDALPLDDRDVFTAFELATALPLSGAACADFVQANDWARTWVPGLDYAVQRAKEAPRLERPASRLTPLARRLDPAMQQRWDKLWNEKYGWLDDATRARRFKRSAARATNHLHDFRGFVIDSYATRCAELGIDPLQAPTSTPPAPDA